MRTIEVSVYKFEELSDEAKQRAIQDWQENQDHDFVWQDAEATVNAFNNVFNLSSGYHSWLDYRENFDDNVLELTGLRLRTYILNNFGSSLYVRKFMGTGGYNKVWIHPCYEVNRYDVSKGARVSSSNFYYSRIQKVICYNLTGMCYDYDMLAPIYHFIAHPVKGKNIEDLLDECFAAIKKTIDDDIEWRQSDEYISEELVQNEYEFTEDGERY